MGNSLAKMIIVMLCSKKCIASIKNSVRLLDDTPFSKNISVYAFDRMRSLPQVIDNYLTTGVSLCFYIVTLIQLIAFNTLKGNLLIIIFVIQMVYGIMLNVLRLFFPLVSEFELIITEPQTMTIQISTCMN